MATVARAFILSRVTDLSLKLHHHQQPLTTLHNLSSRPSSTVACLSSGGGVSDEFVSTRKSNFDRGFTVITNMLKRIEPLDTSVISKGVSESAKESLKQTISTMLGLLSSDQFSVRIRVSMGPLFVLLFSSIITGYTLWNAEYRMSLMRNLDLPLENWRRLKFVKDGDELRKNIDDAETEGSDVVGIASGDVGDLGLQISPQVLGDLSPEALHYIQQLQSELSDAQEELSARKQETIRIECNKVSRTDLLVYLRSLDSNMVEELSRPSSREVEDVMLQLVQNTLKRFFKDIQSLNFMGHSIAEDRYKHQNGSNEHYGSLYTSRDYLAKLLFWCMLLGHHLRGLENRLHLSCVVGSL